jgi:hypothetical protein
MVSSSLTQWLLAFRDSRVEDLMISLVIASVLGALFVFPLMLTVGRFADVRLQRRRHTSALAYATTGGMIGGLLGCIVGLIANSDGPYLLAFGIEAGPVSAAVFWLIRRPDRDAANPATSAP